MWKRASAHWTGVCSCCKRRIYPRTPIYHNTETGKVICGLCGTTGKMKAEVQASQLPIIGFTDTDLIYRQDSPNQN